MRTPSAAVPFALAVPLLVAASGNPAVSQATAAAAGDLRLFPASGGAGPASGRRRAAGPCS